MGAFNISMIYLANMGNRFEDASLSDMIVEANLLGMSIVVYVFYSFIMLLL